MLKEGSMQFRRRQPPTDRRSPIVDHRLPIADGRLPMVDHWEPTGDLIIEELEERCVPGGTISITLKKKTAGWGC
jgi:hypothetical protein